MTIFVAALSIRGLLRESDRRYGSLLDAKEEQLVQHLEKEDRLRVEIESRDVMIEQLRARLRSLAGVHIHLDPLAYRESMKEAMATWLKGRKGIDEITFDWLEGSINVPMVLRYVDVSRLELVDTKDLVAALTKPGLWTTDVSRLGAYGRMLGCYVRVWPRPKGVHVDLIRIHFDENGPMTFTSEQLQGLPVSEQELAAVNPRARD